MARPMGPRFKVARHLGVNVFNHPKALKRGVKPHKKLSEYGEQLLEKQKLKAYYGVLEKQFKRYIYEALKSKKSSDEVLIQSLERRLDNLVYRLGFASTLRQARQMVVHNHVLVDGEKVNIPSFRVSIGSTISLREKSRKNQLFTDNFTIIENVLGYLEKDKNSFSGKLVRMPQKDEIPVEVKFSKILEFYSK
ncbi:30S ribosomal protein S4 [Clostridium sp. CX1]|uniref:Small ribosomal subunit protein uS4 n=1 Tax=Clostridium tanneri TaxID=3037988 RepID=A0ABU4JUU6_9CLOT|nr:MULTISPECIES: 30S ribosomal protein S4 [unclassified Clostridium]MCT8975454.1 30S ribosomal protein S4 [Clostridium sp. CX1]MDW8801920.1 30S ribosomal protein S4 [Clostridium sp. A1-XYC3]